MNKVPSEYKLLNFFSKQSKSVFSAEIAKKLRRNKDRVQPMINWLASQQMLFSELDFETSNIKAPKYKITPEGYKRLHELKMERRLFAISAISAFTSIVSLVIAIWGIIVSGA